MLQVLEKCMGYLNKKRVSWRETWKYRKKEFFRTLDLILYFFEFTLLKNKIDTDKIDHIYPESVLPPSISKKPASCLVIRSGIVMAK